MPVFGTTKKESYRALQPAKEGVATAREAFDITFDTEYYVQGRRDVESTAYRDEWKPILEAIENKTGEEFWNPGNWLYLPTPDDNFPEYNPDNPTASLQAPDKLYNRQEKYDTSSNKIFDYITENADLFADVPEVQNLNGTIIADRVKSKVLEKLDALQQLNKKQRSVGNYGAGFGGGMAATITDLPNLGVTVGTVFATKGRNLSLWKQLTVDAIANMGAEAIAQEEVMDWYASLDLPYSMEDFYYSVATAGAAGVGLGLGIRGAIALPGKIKLTWQQWRDGKIAVDKANARINGLEYKEDLTIGAATQEAKVAENFDNQTPYKKEVDPSGQKNINDQNQAADAIKQADENKLPVTPIADTKNYKALDAKAGSAVLIDPDNIEIDAAKFQFKEGGDEFGVTERLQDVTEWDDVKSNVAILYETKDGKLFVVDGHQRVALAKKLKAQGQTTDILAYIRKETDGVSIEAVRAEAAAKNMAEGSGTIVDAAKVLRDAPELIKLLPPRSVFIQQAKGLSNLSDEAFMAAVNGIVTPEYGAIVGRYIDNSADQLATMKLLQKLNPQNATQAESIVSQAKTIGFEKTTQTGLFGDEVIADNAFLSRAKLLDAALKYLRGRKSIFKNLVDDKTVIEQYGNKLDNLTNAQKEKIYGQAIETIKQNANNVGAIADNLTTLAKEFEAEGSTNINKFTKRFADNLEQGIKSGSFERIAAGRRGSSDADPAKTDTSESIAKEYNDPELEAKFGQPVELTQIKQELSDLEAEVDQLAKDHDLNESLFDLDNENAGITQTGKTLNDIRTEGVREQKIIDELKDC